TGEIASKRTLSHLAGEFESNVTEVYASPFGGGALAWRAAEDEPLTPMEDGLLQVAAVAKDEPAEGDGELVVTPRAHSALGDAVLRTGQVTRGFRAPGHTVGEHVLVRGVWLSLPRIERALARIDGVSAWELAVSRQGTLDAAVLTVAFARQSLVKNPMWQSRIRQSIQALTPISIDVQVAQEVRETPSPGVLNDLRGHHLGRDRALIG
ncbi:MAG: hypothetical protein HOY71_13005, partial [Nonomuraea sp.]|nr:hypothetical protein [Nonomuraea sp.]